MKLKQLVLTSGQLTEALRRAYPTLPKDVEVYSVSPGDQGTTVLTLSSDEFPDARGKRPGTPLPTWRP